MSVDLVERASAGDVLAFEALLNPRIERMVRTATAIIGSEADARDATQDTLLTIWRELPALREPARFGAWADRILINRCRLVLKRRRRRSVRELALFSDDPAEPLTVAGHEDPIMRRQLLERAFEQLDPDARALLVLHHLEDMPLADIAERLGIPLGTAKSRLHAARQRLGHALEGDE